MIPAGLTSGDLPALVGAIESAVPLPVVATPADAHPLSTMSAIEHTTVCLDPDLPAGGVWTSHRIQEMIVVICVLRSLCWIRGGDAPRVLALGVAFSPASTCLPETAPPITPSLTMSEEKAKDAHSRTALACASNRGRIGQRPPLCSSLARTRRRRRCFRLPVFRRRKEDRP